MTKQNFAEIIDIEYGRRTEIRHEVPMRLIELLSDPFSACLRTMRAAVCVSTRKRVEAIHNFPVSIALNEARLC